MSRQLKYGSICSGVAPQTKAWKALGLECSWFAEIEPFPSAVLRHHFPEIPNLGDFTKIGTEHGPLDLLIGGTPCQAFSVAGLRNSLSDERGNLTLEFVRLADRLSVRGVLWENVPGVLSTNDNAFGCFLGALVGADSALVPARGQRWTNSGLVSGPKRTAAWIVKDAQFFGVAQRRRRVFVFALLGSRNWRVAEALFPQFKGLQGHFAPSREKGKGIAWSTAPSLTASGRGVERTGESRGQDPVIAIGLDEEQNAVVDGFGCLKSREKGGGFEGVGAHSLRGEGFDASEDGTGRGIPLWPVEVAPTLNAHFGDKQGLEDQHALGGAGLFVPTFSIQSVNMVRERKQNGIGISDEQVMYTVTGRDQHAVAFHSRQDPIDLEECSLPIEAKGGQAVAFAENQRGEVRISDISPQLSCAGGKPGSGYPAVAFQQNASAEVRTGDVAYTLNQNSNASGRNTGMVQQSMAVRRLTPRECERLQGMEDDYTLIPWRGKMAPDGPRYKSTGNSWAVPVLNWIGRRIVEVTDLL